MQPDDLLHEFDVLHKPHQVIGEELNGRNRTYATRIQSGRMHMAPFHQAEHLAGHPAHLQRLPIKGAGEGIEGAHDVGDHAVAVQVSMWGRRLLGFREDAGVRFLDHLLAEVHSHEVVLEDVVVEHVLGGFTEVHDPFAHGGGTDSERHVLRIGGASGMVVAANAADATRDEVRIARIFAFHENAVAAEDRGGAVTLSHLAILEVDLGEDAQAANDPGDRVPVHLDQVLTLGRGFLGRCCNSAHYDHSSQ